MAIGLSILNEPNALIQSKMPVWFRFFSDNYQLSAGAKAKVEINIPSGVSVGSVFTLVFNQKKYSYICVASGADDGYEFRSYSSLGTFNNMVLDFEASYYLKRYYNITSSYPGQKIILEAKESGAKWNVSIEGATGGISLTNVTTGTDDSYRPNYKAFVDIHIQSNFGASPVENFLIQLEADPFYDASSGLASNEFVMDFELQEPLHTQLSAYIPLYTETLNKVASSILLSYWIKFGEVYGTDPLIGSNLVNGYADNYKQVLYGAWQLDQDAATLTAELANNKFLNRQPRTKTIAPNSREYLFKYLSSAHQDLQLHCKCYYTDGTTATAKIGTPVGLSTTKVVYVFPCGFNVMSIAIITPSKTVSKYEVYVTNDSDDVLSETQTFLVDYRYFEDDQELIFLGQCGAMETVWCSGYTATKLDTQSEQYQAAKLPWYTKGNQLLKHTLNRQNDIIRFNTGYKSKEYIEWLRTLMQSDTCLMRDGNAWSAIRIVKNSFNDLPTLLDDAFVATFDAERIQFL